MKINFPYSKETIILNNIFNRNNTDNLRIVGGAIRNFLLKKEIMDFDLSCKLTPTEVVKILTENNIKYITPGIDFGTVIAIINGKCFEITSTREDIKTDGRHAIVKYTKDFKIDAGRRDFTFNALYLDFNGNIYDYFNGLNDLENGIVKFIGDPEKRIKEDYLRILRFFRFYCYYGKILDKEGLEECIKYKEKLTTLSSERIKSEMFKILNADNPLKALEIIEQNGILETITGIETFNFNNLKLLSSIKNQIDFKSSTSLILTILIQNKEELGRIKNKWKLSNNEYLNSLDILKYLKDELYSNQDLKKILFLNNNDKNFTITLTIFNSILNHTKISENLTDYINNKINFISNLELKKLPINGNDLIQSNFANKKIFKEIISQGAEIFIKSNYSATKAEIIKELIKEFK